MSAPVRYASGAWGEAAAAPPATPRQGSSFAQTLERAMGAVERSSGATAAVGDLGPAEALALQATLYRHAERLELASKLLDHGVGAIKTLLQTRL